MRRAIDVLGATILGLILSPILAALGIAIRLRMGKPVLFRQLRPGYKGEPFEVYKFRTMRDALDEEGNELSDQERLTRLGVFMRQLSLDELPQLWNIVRGDMSFIGPRPLLMEFLRWYSPEQMRRHDVKPGVTGWAQVQGRHDIPFSKRLALDVWYVDNRSLRVDLKILGLTLLKVFSMRGAQPAQTDAEVDDVGLHDAVVVEDHSHDPFSPWALGSEASYAFSSLRKTLPIPDGGILWSPRGLDLPPQPRGSADGSELKLAAMLVKGRYLAEGGDGLKKRFRRLQLEGEEALARAPVAAASPAAPEAVIRGAPPPLGRRAGGKTPPLPRGPGRGRGAG